MGPNSRVRRFVRESHKEQADGFDGERLEYSVVCASIDFLAVEIGIDRDRRPDHSRNSNAASGPSQLIQLASGSIHGAAAPVTVARPPISLSTTAEQSNR